MNATTTETIPSAYKPLEGYGLAITIAGMMQFPGAHPALPVEVSPTWRRTHKFDIYLVHPDGTLQGYFSNCDRVFARRAADMLSTCTTYGQQIVRIHYLHVEARLTEERNAR